MNPSVKPAVKPTVLVTGATGYVGRRCAALLSELGYDVIHGSRFNQPSRPSENWVVYGDAGDFHSINPALKTCRIVVHCAGQNLVRADARSRSSAWAANVDFTRTLAEQSAQAGVGHFILISSAHVVAGSQNISGWVSHDAPPRPQSAYAETKFAAERVLAQTSAATGLGYTILRPVMVYGPAAGGNFVRLAQLARSGIPLPLAGATAPKSFVFIGNLVSAIAATVLKSPPATNGTFLISDPDVTSTAAIIREIACHAKTHARLFRLPRPALQLALQSVGFREEWVKLFEPFVVDSQPFCDWAGWTAPFAFTEAIRLSVTGGAEAGAPI